MNFGIGYFKEITQQYRLEKQVEVSPYALKFAYSELQAGRKTPLVEKIEQMLGVSNLADLHSDKPLVEPDVATPRQTPAPRHKDRGIDYAHPDMLKLILDPSLNLDKKGDSAQRALDTGKFYTIDLCRTHGTTLHRAIETFVSRINATRAVAGCVVCNLNAGLDSTKRRISEIEALTEKVLSQSVNSELVS